MIFNLLIILLPWKLRRYILVKKFKFNIHPTAYIGLSYIYPKELTMEENATIGHFNVAIHLDKMFVGKNSCIGRDNWITGFPTKTASKHFSHDTQRKSELIIGKESAITKKHHIDCTNSITIGNYVTVAGYGSQFLTHSIDIYESRQDSHPITIGDNSFISTGVIVLGGSVLPSFSVLGAGAVLNKAYEEKFVLYAGVPAKAVKRFPQTVKYFNRNKGFVY